MGDLAAMKGDLSRKGGNLTRASHVVLKTEMEKKKRVKKNRYGDKKRGEKEIELHPEKRRKVQLRKSQRTKRKEKKRHNRSFGEGGGGKKRARGGFTVSLAGG